MPSFQDLPVPILFHILTYMPDVTTVGLLECTCRDFRQACVQFRIWEILHRRRWTYASSVRSKRDYQRRHELDNDTLNRVKALRQMDPAPKELFVSLLSRGRESLDVCCKFHDDNPGQEEFSTRLLYVLQRAAMFDQLIRVHYQLIPTADRLEDYAILSGLLCADDLYRNFETKIEEVRTSLDQLAARVQCSSEDAKDKVLALNHVLFDLEGFTGNVGNYYDYHNSLLHCAIERKTAIPMTLAILYKLVGRRINLDVDIVGLPGHIVVGIPAKDFYVDVFHQGRILQIPDLVGIVNQFGIPFRRTFLNPLASTDTLRRVCNNLRNQRQGEEDSHRVLTTALMSLLLVNHNRELLVEKSYSGLLRRWNRAPVPIPS